MDEVKPQLLCFTASWCRYCHQMEPVLKQLEAQGYDLRRIDVSNDDKPARRWHVKGLPSFIAVRAGKELGRIEGLTTLAKLKALLD
jgi:thioredoxin-like negative regulator of GroEL